VAGDEHENLLRHFRGFVSAECDGDGWVTVFDAEGTERRGHCPVCEHGKMRGAIWRFTPPRFRDPIHLPTAVTEWAAKGKRAEGLYLAGQVGTGKTHTAWAAVAAWCTAAGVKPHGGHAIDDYLGGGYSCPSVIFTRLTDLLDDMRPGEDGRQRIRNCQSTGLLVLDDIGAEKPSEWTQERLYSIIDERYSDCQPLIVTSNLPPSKLAGQTGDRVASRLAEMCAVAPMTGTDRRKPAA
jgi:DNA replication protein DnaC